MKLTFSPTDLVPHLDFLRGGIPTPSTLPVLGCVKISPHDGGLALTTTDLDFYLTAFCHGSIAGETVLPFKIFSEAVKQLLRETVIEIGDVARIGDRLEFEALAANQFPSQPTAVETIKVLAPALAHAIEFVRHTVCNKETRYVICGVRLEWSAGEMNVIATDGRRLSHTTGIVVIGDGVGSVTIPAKTIPSLLEMLASDEAVSIGVGDPMAFFSTNTRRIISKRILPAYPDWKAVIPENQPFSAKLATSEFRDALAWCSLATDDNKRDVRLETNSNVLNVSANHDRKASATVPIKPLGPGCINALFDLNYLVGICDALPNEMTLSFNDDLNPIMASSGQSRIVLMPMKA